MKTSTRNVGIASIGLGLVLAANALLGPLVGGVIAWHFSESLLNQGLGLDAFSLAVVAPLAIVAGIGLVRGRPWAAAVAGSVATYTMYMSIQYVIGPEYLRDPGNSERFFVLYLALFIVGGGVALGAWHALRWILPPDRPRRRERALAVALLAIAAFVVFGMYLGNGFVQAMSDFGRFVADPARTDSLQHPSAYWIVAFLDLGVVVPATVAVALALLRGSDRGRWGTYVVVGWFALVPPSVASMAVAMVVNDDPAASPARTVVFCVAAVVFAILAWALFRPLVRKSARERDQTRASVGRTWGSGVTSPVPSNLGATGNLELRQDARDVVVDGLLGRASAGRAGNGGVTGEVGRGLGATGDLELRQDA
jgi:hypothetical protein